MGPLQTRRALAVQLVFMTAFAVSGCSVGKLFSSDGAACNSDRNCPGAQVCCNGKCEKTCDAPGALTVSVTLSTDYVPFYEFDTIAITLDGGDAHDVTVTPVTKLLVARPIAQLAEVHSGRHSVTLALTLQGNAIASSTSTLNSEVDVTVPFVIVRTPGVTCAHDEDCTASDACTTGVCEGGLCMQRRHDGLCTETERCIPGSGCVAEKHECDIEIECDDLVSCTQERCVSSRCTSTADDTRCGAKVCAPNDTASDAATGCAPPPCSADTCIPGPCQTATCQDGVCNQVSVCQSGEQCCNGVCAADCSEPRGCAGKPAGYVCRVVVGTCDIAEVCDGTSDLCPTDLFEPNTFVCRPAASLCDVAEACNGGSGICPANVVVPAGAVCRAVADACDAAESCTGQSAACPVDVYQAPGTMCRAPAGPCDAPEACSGTTPACPPDVVQAATVVCRAAAGPCDIAELCPGDAITCPANSVEPSTSVCRPAVGPCDAADTCDGVTVACTADVKLTGICRPAVSACDLAESCDGVNNQCPADALAQAGTVCASSFCASTTCDSVGNCATVMPLNTNASCDAASCAYCTGAGACSFPNCQGTNACHTVGQGAAGCVSTCPAGQVCP